MQGYSLSVQIMKFLQLSGSVFAIHYLHSPLTEHFGEVLARSDSGTRFPSAGKGSIINEEVCFGSKLIYACRINIVKFHLLEWHWQDWRPGVSQVCQENQTAPHSSVVIASQNHGIPEWLGLEGAS